MMGANLIDHDHYQLFQDLIPDLCEPLPDSLDPQTRYALATSKLAYLQNLMQQGFLALNSMDERGQFNEEDLVLIREAILLTQSEIEILVRDHVSQALTSNLLIQGGEGEDAA